MTGSAVTCMVFQYKWSARQEEAGICEIHGNVPFATSAQTVKNNYTVLRHRFYQQLCTNASSPHVNITNNFLFILEIIFGDHSLMSCTHPNPTDFALQSSLGHAWATACRALPQHWMILLGCIGAVNFYNRGNEHLHCVDIIWVTIKLTFRSLTSTIVDVPHR